MYDDTIKYKNISFSLDPYDESNPNGDFLKKVFYPSILEGTYFGEILFEADFLLK